MMQLILDLGMWALGIWFIHLICQPNPEKLKKIIKEALDER